MMMAANKIPYLTNEDDSIGRRLDIIELRKSFTGKERDPELFAKIIKEKESIFAWYVV
ncbi:MAG: hypothetical protein H6766_06510 [Candidatus Peribacteria bacterium]|nr:MAG: hypothetical protein H6766_06510 [Candidatus Peribacteria bacterium]